jgi:hypothetical protein
VFPIVKKIGFGSSIALAGMTMASLCLPAAISANDGYVPPTGRDRPQRTQGGGSRGCPNAQPISLQLLIPSDHTAQTVTGYPTFAWYISTVPSMPMQFALTETGATEPILVKQLTPKQAGIVKFTLPTEASELKVGKEYRWTVSLICNTERPSQSVYARAWIERVAISSELANSLASSKFVDEKAGIYAAKGIWYDAIASLLDAPANSSNRGAALLQTLLRQVGFDQTIASNSLN